MAAATANLPGVKSSAAVSKPITTTTAKYDMEHRILQDELMIGTPVMLESMETGTSALFPIDVSEEGMTSPMNLKCSTNSTAAEGDVDLALVYEDVSLCTSESETADEFCTILQPRSGQVIVEVYAFSNSTSVQVQCDLEPVASLTLGTDIPLFISSGSTLYYEFVKPPSSSGENTNLACYTEPSITTGEEDGAASDLDIDLTLESFESSTDNKCVSKSATSNEMCNLVGSNSTTMLVSVAEFGGAQVNGEIVLHCSAGSLEPVNDFNDTTLTFDLVPGQLVSYKYEAANLTTTTLSHFTCQITATTAAGDDGVDAVNNLQLTMDFENKQSNDKQVSVTGNSVNHLGVSTNNPIIVTVSSDVELNSVSLDCTSEAVTLSPDLVDNTTTSVTLEENGIAGFVFKTPATPAVLICDLIVPDGLNETLSASVDLSMSVPDSATKLRTLRASAVTNTSTFVMWEAWPGTSTDMLVTLENHGYPQLSVEVVCSADPFPTYTFGQVEPVVLDDIDDSQTWALNMTVPGNVTCNLNQTVADVAYMMVFEITEEAYPVVLWDSDAPFVSDSLEPSRTLLVSVVARNATLPDDEFSLLCTAIDV